jgi:hypothetical protein
MNYTVSQMVNLINAAEQVLPDLASELEELAISYVDVPEVEVNSLLERYDYQSVNELFEASSDDETFLYI